MPPKRARENNPLAAFSLTMNNILGTTTSKKPRISPKKTPRKNPSSKIVTAKPPSPKIVTVKKASPKIGLSSKIVWKPNISQWSMLSKNQKVLVSRGNSKIYTSAKFPSKRIPRGFPLRLLNKKHEAYNSNNNNLQPNEKEILSNENKKASTRLGRLPNKSAYPNINFSSKVSSLAHFIAKKVVPKVSGLKNVDEEVAQIIHQCINLVKQRQNQTSVYTKTAGKVTGVTSLKNNLTSSQISEIVKDIEFDFKSHKDVAMFLVVLFCDYLHDLDAGINVLSNLLDLNIDVYETHEEKIRAVFLTWINHVSWLNPDHKKDIIKSIDNSVYHVLIKSFGKKSGLKVQESEIRRLLLSWMKYDTIKVKRGNLPIPFSVYSVAELRKHYGSAQPHVSFDQSSKTSGPIFYSKFVNKNNKHIAAKVDIALPMIADKGLEQPSNPFSNMIEYFAKYYKNAAGSQNMNKLSAIVEELAKLYTFNTAETFTISFKYKGQPLIRYEYYYDSNHKVKVKFLKFRASDKNLNQAISSASNIKKADPSDAIFKTAADLGIIGYAAGANSISVTGDRAAYMSALLFTYLYSRDRLYIRNSRSERPQLFPRSIFESSPQEVFVSAWPQWIKNKNSKNINIYNYNFNIDPFVKNVAFPSNKLNASTMRAGLQKGLKLNTQSLSQRLKGIIRPS
jgi:hypothetical protein